MTRELVARVLYPELLAYGLRLLSYRREEAEEAVQQTWALVLGGFSELRDVSSWRPWIYRILRNVCIKQRATKERPLGLEVSLLEADNPTESLDPLPLALAIRAMPPAYREAITLRYFQKLTYRDVAQILGITEGTAKSNTHKGLIWLEKKLTVVEPTHE